MLSEKYINKRENYYKFYQFIYKFRILFITLLAIILAVSATLMGIKGIVINDFIVSDVTYGSKLEYSSKVIFGDVMYYEFRSENSEKWTREEPKLTGNYYLRGVGKSLFGNLRYGKEEAFTIKPIDIELDTSTIIEYGNKPVILANLQYSDFIPEVSYEIVSATEESNKFNCKIDQSSFKILNKESIDVTYCYNISFKDTYEFNFSPKTITVSSKYECIYDGKEHKSNEIELKNSQLVDKDYITIDSQDSYIKPGKYFNKPNLKIFTSKNIDVTSLYTIIYSTDSYLTINKRPITIETLDFTREYDGTNGLSYTSPYKITKGNLINGDTIKIHLPYKDEVGTYENKGEYCILSKDNTDVTSYYDITIVSGLYTITPRKATVEVYCENKEYNGEWLDNLYYKSSNLLENHYVILNCDKTYAFANTYQNHEVNVRILNSNSNDVTKNYELTIKYANGFTVTKRPLTIEIGSKIFKYDGEYKSCLDYNITSGELLDGETIKISKYSKYKEVGTYENVLEFAIQNKTLGDVTSCYELNIIYGTIEITEEEDSGGGSGGNFHVFYYDAKTSGKVFITEKINFGYYNGKTYDKIDGYTIKNDYNPEEYINYLLGSLATKAEGTIILPEDKARSSDLYLNYPKFDRKQKTDTYPQISDLYSSTYNVSGLHYDYLKNPDLLDNLTTTASFKEAELDYRKYVKANYNQMDDYTLNYLKQYIKDNSLEGDSIKEIALNLIKHIKKNFKYSTKESNLEAVDKEHPFISFLRDTKIGKCDYFATFGTLVYRALGYSSRMIVGYSTGGSQIKTYDVKSNKAHAICQVYIDGKGWINLEFTVAENMDEGEEGGDEDDSGDDYDIILTSEGGYFTYDGKYHKCTNLNVSSNIGDVTVKSFFNLGYIRVGTYKNTFDAFVYDSKGNLIDENVYSICKNPGEIVIEPRDINVTKYKFNAGRNQLSGHTLITGIKDGNLLAEGDSVVEFTILDSTPGCELGETYIYNAVLSKIVNANGEDVTNCYKRKIITLEITYVS